MLTKKELISKISERTQLSKTDCTCVVEEFVNVVKESVRRGEGVQIIGFGTFESSQRAERDYRNLKTGEIVHKEACQIPKFKPGKAFKEFVNQEGK